MYRLPYIEDYFDTMAGAHYFCCMDMASGYYQVPMAQEDKAKTAFCTRDGLYQFKVMPFGLCNAPATFERLMESVLRGLLWEKCLVYIDDIICFFSSGKMMITKVADKKFVGKDIIYAHVWKKGDKRK